MANKELVYLSDVRRALLRFEPEAVYTLQGLRRVDAVEVVRCRDCKHGVWDEEEGLWKCVYDAEFDERYGEYFGFAEYNDGLHYCSYGERRKDGVQ